MIWQALIRAGTLISTAAFLKQLYDLRTREIVPNRIYSSHDAARFLGIDRRDVVRLLKDEKLKGKMVNGNYRIPGHSIIGYFNQ
nr:Magnetosome protein MamR [uncultured bacterium]